CYFLPIPLRPFFAVERLLEVANQLIGGAMSISLISRVFAPEVTLVLGFNPGVIGTSKFGSYAEA
ncbi:MAG: hypothetical protein ACRD24_01395, partial [Terriglobales bacterium]